MSDNNWYVIVDDQSPRIQYRGKWFNEEGISGAWNHSLSSSSAKGSSAIFRFRGNFVAVRGAVLFTNPDDPPTSSYAIDGGTPSTYTPLVSENNTIPTTFFISPQLSDADHTLNITILSNGPSTFLDYILFNATSAAMAAASSSGTQPTLVQTIIIAPSSAPDSGGTSTSNSPPVGPIVGGVVGGVAILVIAILAFYFFYWDKRGRRPYYYEATSVHDPEFKGTSSITPFALPPPQPSLTSRSEANTSHTQSVYSRSSYPPTEFAHLPSPTTSGFATSPPVNVPVQYLNQPSHVLGGPSGSTSSRSMSQYSTDTGAAGGQVPSSGAGILPSSKAAEAGRYARSQQDPVMHRDSGYRFEDTNGAGTSSSSSTQQQPQRHQTVPHDPQYPDELPPSYSEA